MKTLILTLLIACTGLLVNAQTADELFDSKQYSKAYVAYQKLINDDGIKSVKILRRLGYICYISEGQEQRGIGYFNDALKLDPKDVSSNYFLGLLYKQLKENEKAKKHLQIAADLGSNEAKDELKDL